MKKRIAKTMVKAIAFIVGIVVFFVVLVSFQPTFGVEYYYEGDFSDANLVGGTVVLTIPSLYQDRLCWPYLKIGTVTQPLHQDGANLTIEVRTGLKRGYFVPPPLVIDTNDFASGPNRDEIEWISDRPILIFGGLEDVEFYVASDNPNDVNINGLVKLINPYSEEVSTADSNLLNVNVKTWDGNTVSNSASGYPNMNAYSVADGTPASNESIRAEWDNNSTVGAAILADTSAQDSSAEIRTLMTGSDTAVATASNQTTIIGDTNELQTDWTNAGRLDTIIDSILTDTGTTLDDFLDTEIAAIKAETDKIVLVTAGAPSAWGHGSLADEICNKDSNRTFSPSTDSLEAMRDIVATVTKQDVIDGIVDNILADSNELQTDWTNGGRLDLILDAILLDTGTTIDTVVAAILADSNELQTDWTNGGRLDLLIDAIPTTPQAPGGG